MEVPWQSEIYIEIQTYDMVIPDAINVYINNLQVDIFPEYSNHFYLQSQKDGRDKDVLFEFVSDGNLQSLGFKFAFEEKSKC